MKTLHILLIGLLLFFEFSAVSIAQDHTLETKIKRAYLRSTLPYETSALCGIAEQMRKDADNRPQRYAVQHLLVENILRLSVCLSDDGLSDEEKKYAINALDRFASYASKSDILNQWKEDEEYDLLPNDIVLPPRMKVRNTLNAIVLDAEARNPESAQ